MSAAGNQSSVVQEVAAAVLPGLRPPKRPHRRALLAALTSRSNRSASSSVITAVVAHAPENVIHTRPSEPWPCRVTITVAGFPSGVDVGNTALNISYGVLTTYHRETGCGTQMVMTPAGPLAQQGLNLILLYGQLTKIDGSPPATPDTASAAVRPTSYGTVDSDHHH